MNDYPWLLYLIAFFALHQLATIAQNLQRTAAMMKRFLAQQGIEWETELEPSATVKELALDAKTRVAAIKAYREQTGLGVREAKIVVDRLSQPKRESA